MKQLCTILSTILVFVVVAGVGHAETSAQDQLLSSYIQYLKNGDTQGLLSVLANPLLQRHKAQLEGNPGYSSFLAKHYDQAQMTVLAIEDAGEDAAKALLEVLFAGSTKPHEITLLLKRLDGQWKVVDELN